MVYFDSGVTFVFMSEGIEHCDIVVRLFLGVYKLHVQVACVRENDPALCVALNPVG